MSAHRFLDVPELGSIVSVFVVENGYDQGIRSSLYINLRWQIPLSHVCGRMLILLSCLGIYHTMRGRPDCQNDWEHLRESEDLSTDDRAERALASGQYGHQLSAYEHPVFVLRRLDPRGMDLPSPQNRDDPASQISGATNSDKLRTTWGGLYMHYQVYSTLLSCLPDICLFPKLRAIDVAGFGGIPEVLAMFISPTLRCLSISINVDNAAAAACIMTFFDRTVDACPFARLTVSNSLAMDAQDEASSEALDDALLACPSVWHLIVDYLSAIQWRTVAVLPHLVELNVNNGREIDHTLHDWEGSDVTDDDDADVDFPTPDDIDGPAFPALRSLRFPHFTSETLSTPQLRLLLEMREDQWPLECFVVPEEVIFLQWKHRVFTVHNLLKEHISADTLTHLVIGTMYGPSAERRDPFHHIEPLLVFTRLTCLHVYCEFDNPECPSSPLEPEEAREIVHSFPHMRDLLLKVKFPLSELPSLAENCPDLLKLDLSAWLFPHEVEDGRLHVDPPAHSSSSVRDAQVRTDWLEGLCPRDIDYGVATYIELVFPHGVDFESDSEDDA
ncbi:hypothetical protein EV715DRAFT_291430 [Schizophyllum commune]